jgi:hypothetical protein
MLLVQSRLRFRITVFWRWLIALALFAGALIGHGCHGDDVDHELCAPPGPTATAE